MRRQNILAATAIFIGSFLLFGVQPLVGGLLLPYFGGCAAVWTVCLCAYQALLVAGYFYAHWIANRRSRRLLQLHCAFLLLAAIWVFVSPQFFDVVLPCIAGSLRPSSGTLAAVLSVIGLPYVLLSSNSSVIQAHADGGTEGGDVYGLYAVSNAGSLAGLFAYPFLLEPLLPIAGLFSCLAVGLLLYAGLLFVLLLAHGERGPSSAQGEACAAWSACGWSRCGVWFGLSAFSCFLLNAVTTQVGQGVSPMPLMWVVLLGVYLLSWIFGFSGMRTGAGALVGGLTVIAGIGSAVLLGYLGSRVYFAKFVFAALVLFGGCLLAHDGLFRARPERGLLTNFYLMIALGGACGGLLASLVFPCVTTFVLEYPLAVAGAVALGVVRLFPLVRTWLRPVDSRRLGAVGALSFVLFLAYAVFQSLTTEGEVLSRSRNFYAVTSVQSKAIRDGAGRDFSVNTLDNNGTMHGLQQVVAGQKTLAPTTYYIPTGGGMAFEQHPLRKAGKPIRAALCGMGIGTLAAYGNAGDFFRYYEIDPSVVAYATNTEFFTFLSSSSAQIDIVEGDARQLLVRESARGEAVYDLIVVDVFSGDSIPTHMATKEAFSLYLDRLAPDGILAVHLSNWHLDLSPLMKAVAKAFALHLEGVVTEPDAEPGRRNPCEFASCWAYLSRRPMGFRLQKGQLPVDYGKVDDVPLITDALHSLMPFVGKGPIRHLEECGACPLR